MLRKLARLVGSLGVIIPVGVLAAWGGMYLYACLLAVSAAGVPLQYVYESPGGPLRLYAESFSYDYRLNSLRLTKVSIKNPQATDLLTVSALSLFDLVPGRRPLRIEGNGLVGVLERLPEGRFQFEDYLPSLPESPDEGRPYSVEVRRVSLLFRDRATPGNPQRWLSADRLTVDGVGPEWQGGGKIRVQDVGEINVRAAQDRESTTLVVHGERLELRGLLSHLTGAPEGKDLPELRELQARTLSSDVRAMVRLHRVEPIVWQAQVDATGSEVRYGTDFAGRETRVRGTLAADGFSGVVEASWQGGSGRFAGRWRWDGESIVAGSLETSAESVGSVPGLVAKTLPKGVQLAGGDFRGQLSLQGSAYRVQGQLSVRSAKWDFMKLEGASGRIDVSERRIALTSATARLNGSPATGALEYSPQSGRIQGFVSATGLQLKPYLREAGIAAIDGWADAKAVIFGTISRPEVAFRASGAGSSTLQGQTTHLGKFEAAGRYASGQVLLNRFSLAGAAGATTATGQWHLGSDRIEADLVSTSVPLQAFFDSVSGSAAFSGRFEGNRQGVKATGTVEVFGGRIAGQDIPFLRGDVTADREGLVATNVLAYKRGAQASGEGTIKFRDGALAGTFQVGGIDLSHYPPEGMTGVARITAGVIGGTIASPILTADVEGESIVAQGITLERIRAKTTIADGRLVVTDAQGALDGGIVRGSGAFQLAEDKGEFSLAFESVPLRSLVGSRVAEATVEGLLNGDLTGSFDNLRIASLMAKTQVNGLKVNDALLGNGSADFETLDGNLWKTSVFLGDLSSYIQIPNLTYDLVTGALVGEVAADNLEASLLYQSARRYLVNAQGEPLFNEETRAKLDTFGGKLDLDARLSGKLDDLNFDIATLALSDLTIAGQRAGEIAAKAARENRVWTISDVSWQGGPGTLSVRNGTVDERGEVNLDGELRGFRWSWLAPFNQDLAKVAGQSDLSFALKGATQSPEVLASLSYEEGMQKAVLSPWPGASVTVSPTGARTRRVDLETVRIRDGEITADGIFNVEGFTGSVSARLPFRYPFDLIRSEALSLRASIPERPVASLSDLLPWLDPKRTEGTFSASIDIFGTLNDPDVRGRFTLGSPLLGIKGQATALKDASLLATFEKDQMKMSAKGTSTAGGTFESEDLGITLDNLSDIFEDPVAGALANRLFGGFRLSGFGIEYLDPTAGPISATLSGAVQASGSLRQPTFSGAILVDSANLAVPTITPRPEGTPAYLIDPRFDIAVIAASNLVLRAGTGRFDIVGSGKVEGSLSSPMLTSNLEVAKGSVRLPNARITLEPGGTVSVTYRSGASGTAVSRVEVDLMGRTQVTAQSFTGIVERYDITLSIRGDLLAENGLQLRAQSDPPDLSSDRILAILGQGDVFANRAGENFRADRQLQSALLGLALPYFAGSITEQFANRLGLDYLNVEYNQFDQFSLTAAITLGRDFVITGRRQISSPLPGERLKYDLRLSYRPPFRSRALRRFNFSIGTDQDRPWKVSVEYGIKF